MPRNRAVPMFPTPMTPIFLLAGILVLLASRPVEVFLLSVAGSRTGRGL
jgi:hypothetical protein